MVKIQHAGGFGKTIGHDIPNPYAPVGHHIHPRHVAQTPPPGFRLHPPSKLQQFPHATRSKDGAAAAVKHSFSASPGVTF
jgi:hypothetical protein